MEEGEEEAAAIACKNFDEIRTLFDLYWYHHLILFSPPPPPPPAPALPEPHRQPLPPQPTLIRRSLSDESSSTFLPPAAGIPRLETILSGKEALNPTQSSQEHFADIGTVKRRRSRNQLSRRSISELEIEELKGIVDLGFKFSDTEAETDPRIADIVPGLKKRSEGAVEVGRRPYLSEVWRARDKEERRRRMSDLDWTVLASGDERHLKEQLRRWAHAVVSTVGDGKRSFRCTTNN